MNAILKKKQTTYKIQKIGKVLHKGTSPRVIPNLYAVLTREINLDFLFSHPDRLNRFLVISDTKDTYKIGLAQSAVQLEYNDLNHPNGLHVDLQCASS